MFAVLVPSGCGRLDFSSYSDGRPSSSDSDEASIPMFVQHAANVAGAKNASFAMPVARDALILVAVDLDEDSEGDGLTTVNDDVGDTFEIVGPFDGMYAGGVGREYLAYSIALGGATTIQLQLSAVRSFLEIRLHEYANISPDHPFEGAAGGRGSVAQGSVETDPVVTSERNELVFGVVIDGVVQAGEGFTTRGTDFEDVSEDLIAVNPGEYRASATVQGEWFGAVAAFRTNSP
ncbi:MAG: hypothetical protein QM831_22245 [Kofleriaceae bacterium]